jgi:hypothetical protein
MEGARLPVDSEGKKAGKERLQEKIPSGIKVKTLRTRE